MNETLVAILSGAATAALISGLFSIIDYKIRRKDKQDDSENVQCKALRYLMLYIIQERAEAHINRGYITLQERRLLHHWHKLYHDGLEGNGDADLLMKQVDALPLQVEDHHYEHSIDNPT